MALDFPSTSGQATDGSFKHTEGGKQWSWDGTSWNLVTNASNYTHPDHSGDVTSNGDGATTITNDVIEEKHINAGGTVGANKVLAYDSNESTNWKWVDQSGGGTTDVVSTTADGLAPQLPDPHDGKFLKADASWEVPPDTTYNVFNTTSDGLAPQSPGGTTKYLRADGTWETVSGGGGTASQTVYSGNVVRQLDSPVAIGMSPPHNNGYTGFTDVATNPQTLPVYSNSAGGTEVTANPMLNALDGDTDTYADMSAHVSNGSNNWSKITFSNPLGLRSDGSKEITRIRIGYDGTGHFGYNGGNVTTTGTETGVVKEMDIYDGTAIQLEDLYFVSPTANDKCHLYYVYLITNDISSHGGTKLTVNKHDIIPGSSATGQNGFVLHDSGDIDTNPAGLKLQLTAGTANTVVGVKTDQVRWIVLPLGSTCSLGDKITIMDLGIGYWKNYPYVNERWNPGNAASNPILIFPHDEDGIQGTVRHESYSSSHSAMYQNRFDQANFFGTEDKGLVNQPFHGTPLGISRNGESISVIWCGHEFGWRYLP